MVFFFIVDLSKLYIIKLFTIKISRSSVKNLRYTSTFKKVFETWRVSQEMRAELSITGNGSCQMYGEGKPRGPRITMCKRETCGFFLCMFHLFSVFFFFRSFFFQVFVVYNNVTFCHRVSSLIF